MKNRFKRDEPNTSAVLKRTGPVVTISRDYGCPAKRISERLSKELNQIEAENYSGHYWHSISKEILEKSAQELKLKARLVREVVNREQDGLVDDIIMSLSHRDYPGDIKIKKTMRDVIRSFAERGHAIIVGRGGVSITRDIEFSLHIRLKAPVEWRINQVSKEQMISLSEAKKKIDHIDLQRSLLREYFAGRKVSNDDFDVIYNYMTLDEEDIIASIIKMMECKDMI
jgi:cytidylate kinase